MFLRHSSAYRSWDRGDTCPCMCASHRSRKLAIVSFVGSMYAPPSNSVSKRRHSASASFRVAAVPSLLE